LHSARRPHATPSARRTLERSLRNWGAVLFRYRLRVIADLAVAALVLCLPLGLNAAQSDSTGNSGAVATVTDVLASSSGVDEPVRAQVVARGETITAAGDPRTAIAPDVKPAEHYKLEPGDTLQKLANHYKISAEAIAYSNGITNPDLKAHIGREILIPPGEGALYTVKEGDTIQDVASQFNVDPKAIMDHSRLYFEPENFAPGKTIFVPGATVPGLVYVRARPGENVRVPSVLSRPNQAVTSSSGQFIRPVNGPVSQYFWAFHTGVDLPAQYGSGIAAAGAGTVVAAGWVPVGGLSIRIRHADGFETGYYHTGALFVTEGQQVTQGQIIATIGMTGVTTGPHLHWELKRNGVFVNPFQYTVR
jgi:murein DD-endopeptidase MepM/ murein hydrolase activator NlpD